MAKETDGRSRATMNEADLEYLRNISTRPGPNAGRSIDPTKPGPNDVLPKPKNVCDILTRCEQWLRHEVEATFQEENAFDLWNDTKAALAQSDAEPVLLQKRIAELERDLRLAESARDYANDVLAYAKEQLAQSNAEPGILHNKEAGFKEVITQDTAAIYDNNPQPRLVEEIFDFDRKLIGFRVYDAPPRPDASADRKALQSLHWHLLNRTENREVLLGIVEDALGFRARAADRSEK